MDKIQREKLRQALNAIDDIQFAQGLNKKKQILESYKDNDTLKDILYFVFNPYIKTGIGWSKLSSYSGQYENNDSTIQGIFTYIMHNNTGRDKDIKQVVDFILSFVKDEYNEHFAIILQSIFTKSLKLGISTTTIHKVWPGLIPGFGIQLACKWLDHIDELEHNTVFLTEKLDGNRCFMHVHNGQVTAYSRSGKEIEGLDDIIEELRGFPSFWYDGELLGLDFNETQKQTLKKGKKSNLVFNVFDILTEKEVENQYGEHNYSSRRTMLEQVFSCQNKLNYVKIVPLVVNCMFDKDHILQLLDEYTSNGSEGLMINLDKPYQFCRTTYLLKVKKMYTLDLRVKAITEGNGENHGKVGALIVDYKGYDVGVGSGLSKELRERYWSHPEDIIGHIIEVKCFEESKDKNGNLSLRFPVYIQTRYDKEEISYD